MGHCMPVTHCLLCILQVGLTKLRKRWTDYVKDMKQCLWLTETENSEERWQSKLSLRPRVSDQQQWGNWWVSSDDVMLTWLYAALSTPAEYVVVQPAPYHKQRVCPILHFKLCSSVASCQNTVHFSLKFSGDNEAFSCTYLFTLLIY